MRVVQIAGTNGKGSTAIYTASILKYAGYKTGLFLSPHILREEERISINGEEIPPEDLERLAPAPRDFRDYTQAAVKWFNEHDVDVAVMETGLGGRFDPVTELGADVNVLTTIGMDHMDILGDTVQKIALEKCASIRFGGYCVTQPQREEVYNIIEATCHGIGAALRNVRREDIKLTKKGFSYKGIDYELSAIGSMQPIDAATAIDAVHALSHICIFADKKALKRGIKKAKIPVRVQYFAKEGIIIDGAHNEDSIVELKNTLDEKFAGKKIVLLTAAMANKDISGLADLADKRAVGVVVTTVGEKKFLSAAEMAAKFENAEAVEDVVAAFENAKKTARQKGALLVVAGSFYLAGEVLCLMKK